MTLAEYFAEMLRLGYPRPSINLWIKEDGTLTGSASYHATCGHGGPSGAVYKGEGALIKALFMHVTDGGRTYAGRYSKL